MNKPTNITYDELVKTITMFWIDNALEESINAEVEKFVTELETKLTKIGTKEGLRDYIRSVKASLGNILGLMEVSEEKFKRIISMLRRDRKYVFSTEWSLDKTRSVLLDQESFMDDVCELLLNGANSDRFKRKIPDFYRKGFVIDDSILSRLSDQTELARLAKKQLDVKYNNSVANAVARRIEETVKFTCDLEGLTLVRNKEVEMFGKSYCIAIPNAHDPCVLIDYSYNITTSSTQSRYAEKVKTTQELISNSGKKIITINVIEGAGWVGRQSDLRQIYDCSDYTLNVANIGLIDQIIRFALEDKQ